MQPKFILKSTGNSSFNRPFNTLDEALVNAKRESKSNLVLCVYELRAEIKTELNPKVVVTRIQNDSH